MTLKHQFFSTKPNTEPSFETELGNPPSSSPRDSAETAKFGDLMVKALTRISLYWDSEKVEQATLTYALNWEGVPDLAKQLDVADDYCSAWTIEWFSSHSITATYRPLLEAQQRRMDVLLASLRQRVQFIQTRAGDLRLTGKVEEISKMLLERDQEELGQAILKLFKELNAEVSSNGENVLRLLREIEQKFPEVKAAKSADYSFPKELTTQLATLAKKEGVALILHEAMKVGPDWAMALYNALLPYLS